MILWTFKVHIGNRKERGDLQRFWTAALALNKILKKKAHAANDNHPTYILLCFSVFFSEPLARKRESSSPESQKEALLSELCVLSG